MKCCVTEKYAEKYDWLYSGNMYIYIKFITFRLLKSLNNWIGVLKF